MKMVSIKDLFVCSICSDIVNLGLG
jgi:hypothetical protein